MAVSKMMGFLGLNTRLLPTSPEISTLYEELYKSNKNTYEQIFLNRNNDNHWFFFLNLILKFFFFFLQNLREEILETALRLNFI